MHSKECFETRREPFRPGSQPAAALNDFARVFMVKRHQDVA